MAMFNSKLLAITRGALFTGGDIPMSPKNSPVKSLVINSMVKKIHHKLSLKIYIHLTMVGFPTRKTW